MFPYRRQYDDAQFNAQYYMQKSVLIFKQDWESAVLRTHKQLAAAIKDANHLELPLHMDPEKNWDIMKSLSFIYRFGDLNSTICDMGSAEYGRILLWLHAFGFRDLYGCDLAFTGSFTRSGIKFSHQNIEKTDYADNHFAFITCLSVIEHGVDTEAFLRECRRILRPGGFLLVSTDYWQDPIIASDRFDETFNCYLKVFTKANIESLLHLATHYGFKLLSPVDLSCEERVVFWKQMDLRFTFIFLALQLTK
jgi:2-polyprenyl-3-methyl-5-hydroxy-6-metoxy-1,4-benzoquinol methylase